MKAMSWVLFSFSAQGAGCRELGAAKSKHLPEACVCKMGSGTGWEGNLVPFGLCILLKGTTKEFVAKVREDLLQSHLGWATGKIGIANWNKSLSETVHELISLCVSNYNLP